MNDITRLGNDILDSYDSIDECISEIILKTSEGIEALTRAYIAYVLSHFRGTTEKLVIDEYAIEIMRDILSKAEVAE